MTSRGKVAQKAVNQLHRDALKANHLIGIKTVHFENLPDNQFDSVPLLEVVKRVEKYITQYKPDIVLTHFAGDLNIDHEITFKAVMTACRPQPQFKHPDIYTFEIPSSTDYGECLGSNHFVANVYVDVAQTIDLKIKALACYSSEMRPFPHSRSLEGIRTLALYRGIKVGLFFAEAFQLIRRAGPSL